MTLMISHIMIVILLTGHSDNRFTVPCKRVRWPPRHPNSAGHIQFCALVQNSWRRPFNSHELVTHIQFKPYPNIQTQNTFTQKLALWLLKLNCHILDCLKSYVKFSRSFSMLLKLCKTYRAWKPIDTEIWCQYVIGVKIT